MTANRDARAQKYTGTVTAVGINAAIDPGFGHSLAAVYWYRRTIFRRRDRLCADAKLARSVPGCQSEADAQRHRDAHHRLGARVRDPTRHRHYVTGACIFALRCLAHGSLREHPPQGHFPEVQGKAVYRLEAWRSVQTSRMSIRSQNGVLEVWGLTRPLSVACPVGDGGYVGRFAVQSRG